MAAEIGGHVCAAADTQIVSQGEVKRVARSEARSAQDERRGGPGKDQVLTAAACDIESFRPAAAGQRDRAGRDGQVLNGRWRYAEEDRIGLGQAERGGVGIAGRRAVDPIGVAQPTAAGIVVVHIIGRPSRGRAGQCQEASAQWSINSPHKMTPVKPWSSRYGGHEDATDADAPGPIQREIALVAQVKRKCDSLSGGG